MIPTGDFDVANGRLRQLCARAIGGLAASRSHHALPSLDRQVQTAGARGGLLAQPVLLDCMQRQLPHAEIANVTRRTDARLQLTFNEDVEVRTRQAGRSSAWKRLTNRHARSVGSTNTIAGWEDGARDTIQARPTRSGSEIIPHPALRVCPHRSPSPHRGLCVWWS